jgi:hypothetical protein
MFISKVTRSARADRGVRLEAMADVSYWIAANAAWVRGVPTRISTAASTQVMRME